MKGLLHYLAAVSAIYLWWAAKLTVNKRVVKKSFRWGITRRRRKV